VSSVKILQVTARQWLLREPERSPTAKVASGGNPHCWKLNFFATCENETFAVVVGAPRETRERVEEEKETCVVV